ncbi:MAG: GntR family transcriptional regulator [Acetivibrionales bacterium]|jgi:GntR family transcriptional regulator
MFQLDFKDRRPLFEQIKEKIKELMINGILEPDEKIPSVRELAQYLTINPNTIQKAYRELENEGFIYSIRGRGSFVVPRDIADNQVRRQDLLREFKKIAAELMYIKVPKEELIKQINNTYLKEGVELDD